MPKHCLWNQLTVFPEANPLQTQLEHKATGKITGTKSGCTIFSFEHPHQGEVVTPTPARSARAAAPAGSVSAYLAFVPSLRLWKVQLHCDGHEPPAGGSPPRAKQQSRLATTHMATCAREGHLGTRPRRGSRLLFYPLAGHILLTPFCFQPHCDLPACAESIR